MLFVELTQPEENVNNIKDFIFKYEITQRYTRHLDEKIIIYLTSNRRYIGLNTSLTRAISLARK